jgi:hypothetical protein
MPDGTDLGQKIAEVRDWASLADAGLGAILGALAFAGILWRPIRRWRLNRARRRLEHKAMIKNQRLAEQARVIDERVSAALVSFRKSVMDDLKAMMSDHAAAAQNDLQQVGLLVGRVAATVEASMNTMGKSVDRIEKSVDACHSRIDDFLTACASGSVAQHFRVEQRALVGPKESGQ